MPTLHGYRIAKSAQLMVGADAILFDEKHERFLLTRRADNGKWCLPGGRMDPGESAAEACEREVFEETGLRVKTTRLIGIYTDPNTVLQFKDARTFQVVGFCFEAQIIGGKLGLSDETTETGWFTAADIATMDLSDAHPQRIADAIANQQAAFIR
jgi:8-oxo-dGTP pyrophosphatase MutT (NUDIX family)